MSKISNKTLDNPYMNVGGHQKYLTRIKKTFYYAKFPRTDRLSLPVTELAAELFSEAHKGRTLQRLHCDDAATISRNACVSPCSLVLAMLYLERLKTCNPEYLEKTAPSDLFLVSLMVSAKFLFEDGLNDEVYMDEWAASGDLTIKELVKLEKDFLSAIDWKVYVSEIAFWKKLNEIEINLANRQSKNRGFSTYTELELLSRTLDVHNLIQTISSLAVVLATTYTLGVLTLFGSVFLASQIPGTFLQIEKAKNDDNTTVITRENVEKTYLQNEICIEAVPNIDELVTEENLLKTDLTRNQNCSGSDQGFRCSTRSIDALNVLKTGILLASIKPCCSDNYNRTDEFVAGKYPDESTVQYIDWDWWTVPAMTWLSKVSEAVDNLIIAPVLNYLTYLETSITNLKPLDLEDQIHKATKTRIQDQMENSWHVEWIDSIKLMLFHNKPVSFTITNLRA